MGTAEILVDSHRGIIFFSLVGLVSLEVQGGNTRKEKRQHRNIERLETLGGKQNRRESKSIEGIGRRKTTQQRDKQEGRGVKSRGV